MALNICIADEVHYTVNGRVWRASSSHNHNTNRPWGRRGTLPYMLACTVKPRLGLGPTLDVNREKKEKKLVPLSKLGCLATYIGYVSRVSTYLW